MIWAAAGEELASEGGTRERTKTEAVESPTTVDRAPSAAFEVVSRLRSLLRDDVSCGPPAARAEAADGGPCAGGVALRDPAVIGAGTEAQAWMSVGFASVT